jgi:thiamine-phosphate pyrophosphorylase
LKDEGASPQVGGGALPSPSLVNRLKLIVILDPDYARAGVGFRNTVRSVLEAGAPAVQVRSKSASSRELFELTVLVQDEAAAFDALVFVNDRSDVARAAGADGVHVGPADLPVASIRRSSPPHFLIGASSDDPAVAARLVADGADYVGCGTVFPTSTKADAGHSIGVDGLTRMVRALDRPVVGIGGITTRNLGKVVKSGCAGVAVLSAVMAAPEPGEAVKALLMTLTPS